ncbi:MAG: LuxR C-terminal-related transcriptional regulator [Coriobacteriales bacterium]|nr:LuxR C-terminal-related transcriptional regulator [Coriobacteriales bacterium]
MLQSQLDLFGILLLAAEFLTFALGFLLPWRLNRHRCRVLAGSACCVAAAGLVCILVLGAVAGAPSAVQDVGVQQAGAPPAIVLMALPGVAALALGLGLAVFNLAWARVFSVLGSRELYRQVIFSYLLGLVLYLLLSSLPAAVAVPFVIVALTGSTILLSLNPAAAEETPEEAVPGKAAGEAAGDAAKDGAGKGATAAARRVVRLLWRPILCTAAFSFMSGLMSEVSAQGHLPLGSFQQVSILASLIVVGTLLLPALFLSRQFDITGAYRIALPISAAGFMLLPFAWDTLFGLTNVLTNMGLMTVSIILWCMLATTTRQTRLSARVVFGACLALVIGARLLGKVLGFVYESHLTQSFLSLAAVALISIYLLSMVSLVLFKGQRFTRGHEAEGEGLKVVVWGKDRYRECCAQIAQAADFTPRETDVLLLLGQGRSIANISSSLFISENTAKSHIRSIYRKLGVHSKQELIDLVSTSLGQ